MIIKYKISDLAKDLNINVKEIIEVFASKEIVKKQNMSLSEKELNFVFEHYTKEKQVGSFDDYLNKNKKEEPKKVEVKKETPKKVEPKKELPKENAFKPKVENKVVQNTTKPNNINNTKPNNSNNTAKPNNFNNNLKPNNNNQKPYTPKPNNIKEQPKGELRRADGTLVENVKHKHFNQENVAKKEFVKVTVDTRTNDVNLDKFNEKYNEMANDRFGSNSRKKNFNNNATKQKFNGKNKFNKNQNSKYQKRETEAEKLQRIQLEKARKAQLKITIPEEITVAELASRLKVAAPKVIKSLMNLGIMASLSEVLDFDTASLIADEMGAKFEKEVVVTIEEQLFNEEIVDNEENLEERPPVVVVMGHVDHGKTSILDAIRKADVTSTEAGGITQHIGAYQIIKNGKAITFLDTPGHEAFTSMRARGANMTDIAVLVVAADDGIMPQTIESINHAKAAGVTIIVAINKMDKPTANPSKVKEQLTQYDIVVEDWGGDVAVVPVSALTGDGIDDLIEMITLTSDVAELKANPNRRAKGVVVEARLDKGKGPIATLLVQNGTLNQGDVIIAGTCVGRVRTMTDDKGNAITTALPSTPVEITGLSDVPVAGDLFDAVEDERLARELADNRNTEEKEKVFEMYQKVTLDNLFSQIEQGSMKDLNIIVKADVQGSAEAVKQSLQKLANEEVRVKVIHTGVGAITKSDIMLAGASGAIVIGFNVRPDAIAKEEADAMGVETRMYRVIYDAISDVKDALKGMLSPKFREVEQGRIEVRDVFKISSAGVIAGCYVQEGKVTRNSLIRLVRDGIVITEEEIDSLRRFKDNVKEVTFGYECGIGLVKFSDIKVGDIFEAYIMEEYRD